MVPQGSPRARPFAARGHPLGKRVRCGVAQEMFNLAVHFNQPVAAWDVGQVTSMYFMFRNGWDFNQPVEAWDVGQVTSMSVRRRPRREPEEGLGWFPRALPFATGAPNQRARAVARRRICSTL